MSIKKLGFEKVPTPGIEIVTPVPNGSEIDHCSRTITLPPTVTLDGVAVKLLITGAGQLLAVTVTLAFDCAPHPARAVRL